MGIFPCKFVYSNGSLEIDRVIVVPLEILNRHCRIPYMNFRKIPIGNRQFRILILPHFHMKKDMDPVRIFQLPYRI
ncbi:hypothetical protein Avbf_16870 [Armadillidium vulgare]|nr:hypothetical protein Avbf_16870 [Armadillidium vulgare]